MTATMVPPRTMVPDESLLPSVLPSQRLTASGVAIPELRNELRRVVSWRNAITVGLLYVQSFGLLVGVDRLVERTGWWPLWIPTFFLMGRAHALFGILSHEGTHRLLFATQKWNDIVSNWMIAPLSFSSQEGYRRSHMAHHRDPLGPNEPDKTLYADYPVTRSTLLRRLRRDATGESGYKILKGLLRGFMKPLTRNAAIRIVCAQIILAVLLGVVVGWWAWFAMWFAPWMTVWRVINRLRAIAEHGGMGNSKDERVTTHHVRQSLLPIMLTLASPGGTCLGFMRNSCVLATSPRVSCTPATAPSGARWPAARAKALPARPRTLRGSSGRLCSDVVW
jgi:fatty acid desaturase